MGLSFKALVKADILGKAQKPRSIIVTPFGLARHTGNERERVADRIKCEPTWLRLKWARCEFEEGNSRRDREVLEIQGSVINKKK